MSDFQKFCVAFWIVVGLFLVGGFSAKIAHKNGYKKGYSEALANAKPDTVWHTDTVFHEKPVEKIKWKDKLVYIPVTDSILIEKHDTTYIALQFEKKMYSDSTYSAQVSGFEPSLDWIEVYQKTAYITNVVVEKKKWSFSVTAGPGVVWNQNGFHGGVGLMVGGSYNF